MVYNAWLLSTLHKLLSPLRKTMMQWTTTNKRNGNSRWRATMTLLYSCKKSVLSLFCNLGISYSRSTKRWPVQIFEQTNWTKTPWSFLHWSSLSFQSVVFFKQCLFITFGILTILRMATNNDSRDSSIVSRYARLKTKDLAPNVYVIKGKQTFQLKEIVHTQDSICLPNSIKDHYTTLWLQLIFYMLINF